MEYLIFSRNDARKKFSKYYTTFTPFQLISVHNEKASFLLLRPLLSEKRSNYFQLQFSHPLMKQ